MINTAFRLEKQQEKNKNKKNEPRGIEICRNTQSDQCRQKYANRGRRIARFLGHRGSRGRVWCRVSVCDSLSGWGLVVRGALVVCLRVRGERLGGQVNPPLLKELQSGCVSARGPRVYTIPPLPSMRQSYQRYHIPHWQCFMLWYTFTNSAYTHPL